jgi:predicted ATPase
MGTMEKVSEWKAKRPLPTGTTLDGDIAALIAASRRKPLVLLIDDLEAADVVEVGRLEKLIRVADQNARILIVGAYRPAGPGRPHPPVRRLYNSLPKAGEMFGRQRLGPLSKTEIGQLLSDRFKRPIPETFVDKVLESTGGRPGAVETMLADFHIGGATRNPPAPVSRRKTTINEHNDGEPGLDLGSIPAPLIEMLQAASILGVEFDSSSLAELMEADELDIEDRLAGAAHYGLLEVNAGANTGPADEESTRYRFTSSQIVPTLRLSLPEERRVALELRRSSARSV